jgi:molybdopterin-guanine dinucleotide biosynthesis protein A
LAPACDWLYLTAAWRDFLVVRAGKSQCHAVLPMNIGGAEPLCAMYHKRCEAAIGSALKGGVRKVTAGLAGLCMEAIALPEWKPFDADGFLLRNTNSPADYEEAKRRLV